MPTTHTFASKPKATEPPASVKPTTSGRGHSQQSSEVRSILHLQRTIGNQVVKRMLRTGNEIPIQASAARAMQTKLVVNTAGYSYEQEADRVSEQIMRMPESRVQRKCACHSSSESTGTCEESGKTRLSLQHMSLDVAGPLAGDSAQPIVHDVLRSLARSLDSRTRAFSRVGIHIDSGPSAATGAVQAQAFRVGSDIVFGSGKFAPSTPAGRKLLSHELTHVVQQGAAPATATHSPAPVTGEGATEAKGLRPSPVSESGRLQRQPKGGKSAPQAEACPPVERNEREEAAKAQLQMVERIRQTEWLIYGFPIGGSEISEAEAGGFISSIVRSLQQGSVVYVTGQDPLEVRGFSDCFAGQQVDNYAIRQLRAANFCAGVKDKFAATPKTYPALIRFCGPAPMSEYVGSNATKADRAQNRSVRIRRVPRTPVQFEEGKETFPYNPKYGPSAAHCAAYTTPQARDILGRVYTNNAHCSCMVTPDEPHNNCVRNCLQDKMWNLLANEIPGRKPGDPPMDINRSCPVIWKHHRECYHDCSCASEFIDYLAFDAVCNIALPCAIDSAAINLMNRCMPAPVD